MFVFLRKRWKVFWRTTSWVNTTLITSNNGIKNFLKKSNKKISKKNKSTKWKSDRGVVSVYPTNLSSTAQLCTKVVWTTKTATGSEWNTTSRTANTTVVWTENDIFKRFLSMDLSFRLRPLKSVISQSSTMNFEFFLAFLFLF